MAPVVRRSLAQMIAFAPASLRTKTLRVLGEEPHENRMRRGKQVALLLPIGRTT